MIMQGKVVMVTGATNGIGEITALELARMGATVVVVSRNEQKCRATVERIQTETGNEHVTYMQADLSLMADVRQLADTFKSQYERLDVLVNNAGAYFSERKLTSEGNEMTLALNHLNYFLLTHLLLDTLKTTSEQYGEARIINVSSGAHRGGGMSFNDLQREKGYAGFKVYAESKLMNIYFTYELARRLKNTQVTANVLHPGFVQTGFAHNNDSFLTTLLKGIQKIFAISPEEGAETNIYLASSPDVKGITGKYWEKSKAVSSSKASYDEEAAKILWEKSEALVGLQASTPAS
jgi:retinol dehydrogenase-12